MSSNQDYNVDAADAYIMLQFLYLDILHLLNVTNYCFIKYILKPKEGSNRCYFKVLYLICPDRVIKSSDLL